MNAFQRFAARLFFGTSSPFEAANSSPRRSKVPGTAPRDFALDLTPAVRSELVRRSRYHVKNSGFLRGFVSSMALYAVGDGIRPQATSKDADWNREAEAYFNRWGQDCEITGRFNLAECQRLVCRAIDVDGEIFVVKSFENGEPRIQLIETHRVGDESEDGVVDGIRLSPTGRPIAYRVMRDDGGTTELPAETVLHIFEPDSISQLRGFPSLQHSINHLLDEQELLALEKHAAKANADIARVLTSERSDAEDSDFHLGTAQADGTDPSAIEAILGGKVVRVQPGESLTPYESNRPSATFTGFLTHLRRDSAQGLLPYEFVADSSQIGGAGVRMIIAKADRQFSSRQTTLIDQLLRPLWLFVIGHAIAKGKLRAVEGWTGINFTTPRRITVDAGREAAQNREDIKCGLKSLSDHFAELGMDVAEEVDNRARDMELVIQTAKTHHLDPRDLLAFITTGAATGSTTPEQKP